VHFAAFGRAVEISQVSAPVVVVLVCQAMTVDKALFAAQQGSLSRRVMSHVDRGLALALGLQEAHL